MSTPPVPPAVGIRLYRDYVWLTGHGSWLDVSGIEPGGIGVAMYSAPYELRKLTVEWSRTSPSGIAEDAAMCTFHFLNLTDGDPDATWTTADYETIEARFMSQLWSTLNDFYPPDLAVSQLVWRADGPAFKPFGASLSPTLRVTPGTAIGETTTPPGTDVGNEALPPQCAVTVTERTAAHYTALNVEGVGTQIRNRWGRVYLPAPNVNALADGRVEAGFAEAAADGFEGFYNAIIAFEFVPVMYSPTTGNAWSIDEISVDDLFDVIRSRRYRDPQARETRTISA